MKKLLSCVKSSADHACSPRSSFGEAVRQAGFTLIELLVVIGILGVLAAALVATIDPFEQLNKAQDANVKNSSVEFLNANIRYFTTHNAMPWFTTADGGVACYDATGVLSGIALTLMSDPDNSDISTCMGVLIAEGELKQGFRTFSGLNKILITNPNPQTGGVNDVIACFKPVSKSGQKDPATKYGADGGLPLATCKSATPPGTENCYWCAQ